ncbi:hypothetical protein WBG78_28885 [Chryseolinea sp. T2]|uniref:hypothetical protein n=1 Tax=Chryseolinea sp. T2 TaxID=3129255 RepID=UPI003077B880
MSKIIARATVLDKLLDVAVVILGITIAFQVDRWKESSDRASREESYLRGMMIDLDRDIQEYQDNMKDLNRHRQMINRSLMRLSKDEDISDSLGYIVLSMLRPKTFEGHNNTYVTITTTDGIGILRTDSIRDLAVEHYRLYSSLLKFESRYAEQLTYFKTFFTPHLNFNRAGRLVSKGIAKDIQTENLLALVSVQQQEGFYRYEGSLAVAMRLKRKIEEELR